MAELTKLGRYQLKRVLGKGAMGVVYEGYDPTLGRQVAVKTILKSVAHDDETERNYAERFVREAKAVARLNHPNIIQVHDFGVENDIAYLVMEFIRGRELRSYFDGRERFEIAETVRIMGELLDALDFAHEAGVIHRDVKPANVMLDAQRRVKLADFGVARIQDSDRSMAGTMVGTPAFMSPEQIKGGKVDGRTDIFSAGTILYQLLTGEQPFKGEGAWTVAKKIVEDDPPPPSSVVVSVSPALDAVVHKALAKEPAQRFGRAREFAAALRNALGSAQGPPSAPSPKSKSKDDSRATEAEVEFWRSIQNSNDPAEIEAYLQEFPNGTYAQLARIKAAKLREPLEAARKAAEEKARQEAEARARRAAEENARREAAAKAKRDAEEKARRESEEKVRQAQALARRKQQEEAARPVVPATDSDATVVVERKRSYAMPVVAAVIVIAGAIGAYLVLDRKPAPAPVADAPVPAPAPAPAPAAPPKPEITAADIEKIKKETEERIRREYADKSAAEQAAAAKAASEKAIQEKQLALKAAADKAAADKAVADKLAAEKALAEKLAAAKSASERAALEKAAAERAAAEKAAQEKAVADKLAADQVAAEKASSAKAAAAARPGWPSVGDRWIYEARDADSPEKKVQVSVEVEGVTPSGMRDISRVTGGGAAVVMHQGNALLAGVAPGIASFWPYLRAFQDVRGGERWTNIDQRQLGQCSSWDCSASARIVSKEQVSVRAGSFAAWKIVVDLKMTGPSMERGSGELTFWYAEEARRTVKYQSRYRVAGRGGVSALWAEPDIDMELVSYTRSGARSATTAVEKAAVEKAPATKEAAPSVEAQLERFIQRKGRDKVMRSEPPPDAHSPHQTPELPFGHVVYVNDGTCGPGRIRQVTGGSVPRNAPRTYRCISLAD